MPSKIFSNKFAVKFKESFELLYWTVTRLLDKKFGNDHYQYFYTDYFDLTTTDYKDKYVMDVGCGPRGSLEWADMAAKTVGLDPLAKSYLKMGANKHRMEYAAAYVENIPFADGFFDICCSFNSLDHVGDIEKACDELKRVIRPGGLFLLIVDIHNYPTPTEPQQLHWSFVDEYFPKFDVIKRRNLHRAKPGKIYTNLKVAKEMTGIPKGNGILTVLLRKPL